ncbi:hypothetical protein Bca4012_050669 [Brassica carinata]
MVEKVCGIKPLVVRLGVKVLMTCFPVRPLRSSFYVEVIRLVASNGILYGCRRKNTMCKLAGFFKTLKYLQRDKFWDLVSRFLILCLEMLETSVLGLGQDLGDGKYWFGLLVEGVIDRGPKSACRD